jgi:hypothetical protein
MGLFLLLECYARPDFCGVNLVHCNYLGARVSNSAYDSPAGLFRLATFVGYWNFGCHKHYK